MVRIRLRKGSYWLIGLFLFFFLLDMYSTFRMGDIVQYLEANPLYIKFGWWPIFLLNAFWLVMILWFYEKAKAPTRFMAVTATVWLSIMRTVVFFNNMKVGNAVLRGEITETMAAAIPIEAKTNYYFITLIIVLLIPIVATLTSYYLFTIDHEVKWKNES